MTPIFTPSTTDLEDMLRRASAKCNADVKAVQAQANHTADGEAKKPSCSIDAARLAIETHTRDLGIDDEGSPELGLWHPLYSLVEFADAKEIDLRKILGDVEHEIEMARKV